jgi:uncharacterized membrane protein YeaQ/YmgE (transglycosylase-associated protein family)
MPDLTSLIWFLIIGIAAGWIAGLIMKGRGFGMMGDLIIGAVGALIGGVIFDFLGFATTGLLGSLIMAVIGAVVLLFLAGLFRRTGPATPLHI